jgi:hypothetical protein
MQVGNEAKGMDRRTTAWLASATALDFHGVARKALLQAH